MSELELVPYDEYVKRLPRKVVSAGMLIRDDTGRVLLVEPSYKDSWEIPGGTVEPDEAPWTTAVREVREEIGVDRACGNLLVMDYVPSENDTLPERIAFVFDGGTIDPAKVSNLVFGPEVVGAALCSAEDIRERVKPLLADRIAAALKSTASGTTTMCERGKPI